MPIGKKNQVTLGEALKAFIDKNNLNSGLTRVQVREAWEKVMGPGVMSYTSAIQFSQGTLQVHFNSSVLKEELSMGKTKIIQMLNEELGSPVISKLILL